MHVEITPEMLRWARERAGFDIARVRKRFSKIDAGELGMAQPTLTQLEDFAHFTHVPIGYLFLHEPPVERVPIPDFRSIGMPHFDRPSPDLLEMVYTCQQRQEWYRDFARTTGEAPLAFVGSAQVTQNVVTTAASICPGAPGATFT